MVIEQLRLQNARVFSDSEWEFNFRPLTVICGTNSAGKSTLLKSLLLLQANLTGRREQITGPQQISFNGTDLDLGNFGTFVSHEDETRPLGLGFTISVPERSFRSLPHGANGHASTITIKSDVQIGIDSAESSSQPSLMPNVFTERAAILRAEKFSVKTTDDEPIEWQILWEKRKKNDAVKTYVLRSPAKSAGYFEPAWQFHAGSKSRATRSIVTQVLLNRCLPEYVMGRAVQRVGVKSIGEEVFYPPNLFLSDVNRVVESAFSRTQLIYIGPLRAPAQRYYVLTTDESASLDASGDFLPYVLKRMHDLRAFDLSADGKTPETTLAAALSRWLYFLRTGEHRARGASDELRTRITKEVLLEAMLKGAAGDEHHALADSGFGYSQVLPIVVRSLMARPGSTLLIEQPEVHLNPALQVRLADFFIQMMRAGKQLIIETHSEHIVNALRVIAAEDQRGVIAKSLQLFYIGAGKIAPIVNDMNVDVDGSLSEWPKEFFGEALSLTQRLLKAQAARARAHSS